MKKDGPQLVSYEFRKNYLEGIPFYLKITTIYTNGYLFGIFLRNKFTNLTALLSVAHGSRMFRYIGINNLQQHN